MRNKLCSVIFVLSLVASRPASAQPTISSVFGVDQMLRDQAQPLLRELRNGMRETTQDLDRALTNALDRSQTLVSQLQRTGAGVTEELRSLRLQIQSLISSTQIFLQTFRTCVRQDARYLLAVADATAASNLEANVPWNRSTAFVSAGHVQGNPMRIGSRVGSPFIYQLSGSFVRFNQNCARPRARLNLVQYDGTEEPAEHLHSIDVSVEAMDSRSALISIPALSISGVYRLEVAYATSSGLFNTCDRHWSNVGFVFPVAPGPITRSVGFTITPICSTISHRTQSEIPFGRLYSQNGALQTTNPRHLQPELGSECRWISHRAEHRTGDQVNIVQSIENNGRTITLSLRSQDRQCRTSTWLGCIDWINHDSGYDVFGVVACDTVVRERRLAGLSGSVSGLVTMQDRSTAVSLPPEVLSSRDGAMCRWAVRATYTASFGGTPFENEVVSVEQRPSQPPSTPQALDEWYRTGSPTAADNPTQVVVSGSHFRLEWNPLQTDATQTGTPSGTVSVRLVESDSCGLF